MNIKMKSMLGSSRRHMKGRELDPDEIFVDSVSALGSDSSTESKIERPIERVISFLFLFVAASGIFYLGSRGALLSIKEGHGFLKKSEENRFLSRPIFPPRGVIYDKNGKALVENIPSYDVLFLRDEFVEKGEDIGFLLQSLSTALDQPLDFFYEHGFSKDNNIEDLPQRVFLLEDLPPEKLVLIAPQLAQIPGIEIHESYRRKYKDAFSYSHLLGFTGKISETDLDQHPELSKEDVIGKSGVEAYYDAILRGKGGRKIIEVDSSGHETQYRLTEEPESGMQLRLTIDGALQERVYEMLLHYTAGLKGASAVILDPRNGEVRSLVSFPGFDSNSFGVSLTQKEFDKVVSNPLKPLFNRALSGEFPSGSTIKPLIAAAALEEKLIDPNKKIYDEGYIEIPNPYKPGEKAIYPDWRKHGWINFYDAIALSANVYFYMIGGGYHDQQGLGIERIKQYAARFGFGSKLGVDLPGEKPGFIPDPESKKISEPEDPIWRIGDTYNVSIGQGGVKVTPLQMTDLTATVANGGTLYRPHILEAILDASGNTTEKISPQVLREHVVSEESLAEVRKGMRETVTAGTARLLGNLPVSVSAKTGTAQSAPGKLPHAWVTAFAPAENPEVAITIMVEYAGEGATIAVPITHDILQWYFGNTGSN